MVIEVFGLTTKFGDLSPNESKKALVDGLDVPFARKVSRGPAAGFKVGWVKFWIQLMENLSEKDAVVELAECLGRSLEVKQMIDLDEAARVSKKRSIDKTNAVIRKRTHESDSQPLEVRPARADCTTA